MATNDRPTIDLTALVQGFVADLRVLGRPAPDRGDERPTQGMEQLRTIAEHVRGEQGMAAVEVNAEYRARTDAMQTVLADRQQRLEAYAERQRQVVPSAPDRFIVAGRVTDQETGVGLPHVRVRATDLDRREHDVLGYVRTDALGYFRLEYGAEDIDEADQIPETFIEVLDDEGAVLFTSTKSFVQKTGQAAFIPAAIEGDRLATNLRMAEKVSAAVDHRHQELAQRQRVLSHRAEVVVDVGREIPGRVALPAREDATTPPAAGAPQRPVTDVKGVGPAFRERLDRQGVTDVAGLARMKPAQVAKILNVSENRAKAIVTDARSAARRK